MTPRRALAAVAAALALRAALALQPQAPQGGGDGGCRPQCPAGEVCCDFESGRRCVEEDKCK